MPSTYPGADANVSRILTPVESQVVPDAYWRTFALFVSIFVIGASASLGWSADGWLGAAIAGVAIPTGGVILFAVGSVLTSAPLAVSKKAEEETE